MIISDIISDFDDIPTQELLDFAASGEAKAGEVAAADASTQQLINAVFPEEQVQDSAPLDQTQVYVEQDAEHEEEELEDASWPVIPEE